MSIDLKEKVALVTGGSRGLGKGVALALAEQGITTIVNYHRDDAAAEKTVKEITEKGHRAQALKADVTKPEEVERLFSEIKTRYGSLDILVNNVGKFIFKKVTELSTDDWLETIKDNLHTVFYCSRCALPLMLEKGWGRIVNIAFARGDLIYAKSMATPYAIAKAGVILYTKSLAKEVYEKGITVNVISPGNIDKREKEGDKLENLPKDITEESLIKPAEIAGTILFLLSEKASKINGTNITISGGWNL